MLEIDKVHYSNISQSFHISKLEQKLQTKLNNNIETTC